MVGVAVWHTSKMSSLWLTLLLLAPREQGEENFSTRKHRIQMRIKSAAFLLPVLGGFLGGKEAIQTIKPHINYQLVQYKVTTEKWPGAPTPFRLLLSSCIGCTTTLRSVTCSW